MRAAVWASLISARRPARRALTLWAIREHRAGLAWRLHLGGAQAVAAWPEPTPVQMAWRWPSPVSVLSREEPLPLDTPVEPAQVALSAYSMRLLRLQFCVRSSCDVFSIVLTRVFRPP